MDLITSDTNAFDRMRGLIWLLLLVNFDRTLYHQRAKIFSLISRCLIWFLLLINWNFIFDHETADTVFHTLYLDSALVTLSINMVVEITKSRRMSWCCGRVNVHMVESRLLEKDMLMPCRDQKIRSDLITSDTNSFDRMRATGK